jgi:hypothetical protein
MRTDITHYVKSYSVCHRIQLIVRSQPTCAFEEVGVDLFTFKQNKYNAFSNFYNFKKLDETIYRVK